MAKINLLVCDYKERRGSKQPEGPVISAWICGPDEDPGQAYADFRVLYQTWRLGFDGIVGFMGVRKYPVFPGFEVKSEPSHIPKWLNASPQHFDVYRGALAKWDGASLLPLLAMHDMIVTPPFDCHANGGIMMDFAASRSHNDAFELERVLHRRGIYTVSNKIYPYIFVTRWSVFDRFMRFAWSVARELESLCKGEDSINEAYKKRPMAYVLERAFSLWLENSGLSFTELPIVNCWEL